VGWVRIDDNAPQHIKMLTAGPHACWLWVCGLAYCQRQKTDGLIPTVALPTLGVGAWKKYAGVLVSAGLWHKEDSGYRIHDYLDWNASADERNNKAEALKERVQKHRDKHARNATVTRYSEEGVTVLPSPPLPSTPANTPAASQRLRYEGNAHRGHVFGFCQFKCLSEEKIQEFAKDLPRGLDDPANFERVQGWAKGVRDGWGDKPKVETRWYEFWEARWKERPRADHLEQRGNTALARMRAAVEAVEAERAAK
jgi:hypothetical protein